MISITVNGVTKNEEIFGCCVYLIVLYCGYWNITVENTEKYELNLLVTSLSVESFVPSLVWSVTCLTLSGLCLNKQSTLCHVCFTLYPRRNSKNYAWNKFILFIQMKGYMVFETLIYVYISGYIIVQELIIREKS